jgi:uncharacterized membrane protein YGL010W
MLLRCYAHTSGLARGVRRGYNEANRRSALEKFMATIEKYMAQYDHEHTNGWNKVLHGIGIPVIIAGLLLAVLTHWKIGLALFVAGWVLLLAGHRIEGNKPAFFQGVIYFLIGPIWVAKELKDFLTGKPHTDEAGTTPPR